MWFYHFHHIVFVHILFQLVSTILHLKPRQKFEDTIILVVFAIHS